MNKKFIPLLLILILLVCITTGIIVSNKYLDDNKDIIEDVIDHDVPKLEIDTDEDTVIEEDIVENEEIENNDQTDIVVDDSEKNDTTDNSNNNSTSNNTTNNNSTSNNTTNNNKPTKPSNNNTNTNTNKDKETDKEEVVPTPPTQEQLNNEYRNTIYNTYGVKVAYGEEMGNYYVATSLPVKMNDVTTINEYLGRVETELKKYPTGFFKEMKDYGMSLTIYLVKDIPNSSISGLTDSQIYSNIIITLKEDFSFETTFNHEMMHYIDAYLNAKLYPNSVDVAWNLLNPEGYTYGSFDSSYDYFPNGNNNSYFLTNYAQTNYKEDRATLFGDLMTRPYKRPCYNSGYPMYNKIKLLAEQIDEGFVTVTSSNTEQWEMFLK